MPPSPPSPAPSAYGGGGAPGSQNAAQSYTQSLLARFNLPTAAAARPGGGAGAVNNAGALGTDFYNFLSSAVSAASNAYTAGANKGSSSGSAGGNQYDRDVTPTPGGVSSLIPDSIRGVGARMSFIEAQRERLNTVLSALDREASALNNQQQTSSSSVRGVPGMSFDAADVGLTAGMAGGGNPWQGSRSGGGGGNGGRRDSRSMSEHSSVSGGGLSRNRSEADFEKLEAESGEEEISTMDENGRRVRHRPQPNTQGSSGWFGWGSGGGGGGDAAGKSTGIEK